MPIRRRGRNIDQTMMALYRANPDAFGGNINILRRGAVLRVPGADRNRRPESERGDERSASSDGCVARRQRRPRPSGHLRLVTPGAGGGATGSGEASAANAEAQALKDRVKDLEGQLADSHRLIDIRNSELSRPAAQARRAADGADPGTDRRRTDGAAGPSHACAARHRGATARGRTAARRRRRCRRAAESTSPPAPVPAPAPAVKRSRPPAPVAESGSWLDWLAANWWVPAAVIIALFAGCWFAGMAAPAGRGGERLRIRIGRDRHCRFARSDRQARRHAQGRRFVRGRGIGRASDAGFRRASRPAAAIRTPI